MTAHDPSGKVRPSCQGRVRYLDKQWRYTGRGDSGFEREWTWRPCKLAALPNGYCRHHQDQAPHPTDTLRKSGDE